MVKVGIIGATGYSGEELLDILLRHPQARVASVSAKIDKPREICEIFPRFKNRISLVCAEPDLEKIKAGCDVIFLALPHTVSMAIAPHLLAAGRKVIDLSADYRLKETATYEKFYKARHKDRPGLKQAVYGLPEIYRNKIKDARLVANPGCYPTAAILALAPAVSLNLAEPDSIIIDAKSGVTGAGRKVAESFLFSEVNEDFRAYKVGVHQHAPEINQEISMLFGKKINVTFVPHLLPLNRGILATIFFNKCRKASGSLAELYKKFYKNEPFIRIKKQGEFPKIRDVVGTNFCDIGIQEDKHKVIIISAIDNLLKGASGQAVQNMNIMYKFPEHTALLS